ncbi:hypothetical protein ILUMI_11522 [Ignelater luminosus]|uniref:Uncharacterized protein n=1 Tax=Ignelater luminosus TaxID=2038154 RepID=A0A8K0GD60_IGNLU|nr:hypothetical protein ILUMI_11522 [Ignelater luminosus]
MTDRLSKVTCQRSVLVNNILEAQLVAEIAKSDISTKNELEVRYEDAVTNFQTFRELDNQIIGLTSSLGDKEFKTQDEIRSKTA